jgi:hypothetical protein
MRLPDVASFILNQQLAADIQPMHLQGRAIPTSRQAVCDPVEADASSSSINAKNPIGRATRKGAM